MEELPVVSPFRYCDVRGTYPDEVNERIFNRLGAAIAARCGPAEPVLVSRDHRVSSPSLHRALVDGLSAGGVTVLDAGAAPTPVLYHAKRARGVRYAVSVTASHNPPHSNGLKLLPPDHAGIAEELLALGAQPDPPIRPGGVVRSADLYQPYRRWMEERWRDAFRQSGKSVILDPGGGSWSGLAVPIFEQAGIPASAIHDRVSSTFEYRSPDCAVRGALVRLAETVRNRGAAAGLAWDGDGDRLALCDDAGRCVSADQLALLIVPRLLTLHPGEPILVDLKMSRRVREMIGRCGGRPVVEGSAHCLLERSMLRNRCLFGCEYSGHYFFRELAGADDGMFAALQACAFLLLSDRPVSESVDLLPPLFITPDIRVPGGRTEFGEIRKRLTAEFRSATIDHRDGLRIDQEESWLVVRQSVSENKITWRVEGDSGRALDSILGRLGRVLPEYRDYLQVR